MQQERKRTRGRTRLLSVSQVQDQLGVSRRTVYRLVSAGDLSPIKLRGMLRFRVSDVERLIAESEVP